MAKKKKEKLEGQRPDGSGNGLARGGVTPPSTKGLKLKRHIPKELDKRKGTAPHKYIKIDFDEVSRLCSIGCTIKEVCSCMSLNQQTIEKAIKERYGMTWKEYFSENSNLFRASLRRLQYRSATGDYDEEGNRYKVLPSVAMQIWLGKQFLDQADKQENVIEEKTNIPLFEWGEAEDITDQKEIGDGEEED